MPGGSTSPAPSPLTAIIRTFPSSASTIEARSNGTRPRSSRMNAVKASSRTSDEPSARAQRLAASIASPRRPSSSRRPSASAARAAEAAVSVRRRPTSQPTVTPMSSAVPAGIVTWFVT